MKPNLGVIGLGNIGGGVARTLLRAGFTVQCADLDPKKTASIEVEGGTVGSVADVASGADVLFTSLPGPKEISAISAEVLTHVKPGSVWVELSTNDLTTARELATACSVAGVALLDAPVSGGPEGAESGTLSVFVGGATNSVQRVMPLLNVIGAKVEHLGPNGAGVVAKIAQVTLCYTQTVTLVEALLLGVKGGIEPAKMLELIQNSAGRSYVAETYGPEILKGTYDASFPISHAAKDMRLAMDLAASLGARLPFMSEVAALYQQAESEYGPTAAHLLAVQIIERQNGIVLHEWQDSPR